MEASAVHSELFGRERALALVAEQLATGRPCVLVGESGIGKSTLAAAIAASEPRAFVGGGLATLAWMSYLPLRRAFGAEPHAGVETEVADEVAERVGDGLLVIDDLQWADPATRRVLELLGGRVRLLLAVRSDDPAAADALALCDVLGAAHVEPEPLDRDDALSLVRAVRADLAAPLALRLVERAGGNPLFLRELAAAGDVSASFRLALASRIRTLSPAASDSLALLALLGRPAEADILGDGAAELVARELADESGGVFSIRHALFAEAAINALADPAPLHARLATAIADPAEAAHHFAAAGLPERAAPLAQAAAETAATRSERAELLALAAMCTRQAEHALRAGRELVACGEYAAAERVLEEVGPLHGRARAEAACVLWSTRYEHGDLDGAAAEVAAGLAAAGDDARLRAELTLADAHVALFDERRHGDRLARATAAVVLAQDYDELRPRARHIHGSAVYLAGDPNSIDELEQAAAAARDSGDADTELRARFNAIAAAETFAQHERARRLAEAAIERARELRLVVWTREFRATLVNLDAHAGRYDAVVRDGTSLLAEGLDQRRRDAIAIDLAAALIDLGRFEEAAVYVEQLLGSGAGDVRGVGMGLWLRAESELWGGSPRAALATIEEFLGRDDTGQWEPFGRAVEAWARHELGRPVARWQHEPLPSLLAGFGDEVDALHALSSGDNATAAARFRAGAESFASVHVRGELRCLLGEALACEDVDLLLALEARAQEHALAPLLARVQRALRLLGVRRSAARGDARAGLTARESEVLELAAAGLTNEAIARRLGIGRSTVKRLVASGARKLGADTRAQAVARFART